jgi:hypothetical protein
MSPSSPALARKERRTRRRFAYPAVVQIDGRQVPGRDISPQGLSILIAAPTLGDIVRVSLAPASADTGEISALARVVRTDAGPDGIVVGLEFIG